MEMSEKEQNQQEVWNALAETWHSYRQKPLPISEKSAKEWKAGKIIDIGCGNCRNLLPFAKAGFDCYGVDFSKKMISLAESHLKQQGIKANLIVEKAEKLPYPENTFDYSIMLRTLPCIKTAEARNAALDEMMRILKKGGKAIVTIWNKKTFRYLLSKKEALVLMKIKNSQEKVFMRYYYMYTPSEIQKLLVSKGFVILDSSNPFREEYYVVVQKN